MNDFLFRLYLCIKIGVSKIKCDLFYLKIEIIRLSPKKFTLTINTSTM